MLFLYFFTIHACSVKLSLFDIPNTFTTCISIIRFVFGFLTTLITEIADWLLLVFSLRATSTPIYNSSELS